MGDSVKQRLAKLILLADQIVKAAMVDCSDYNHEIKVLGSKTKELAVLLRSTHGDSRLYERPARLIILDTEQVLEKALSLILKFNPDGLMKRVLLKSTNFSTLTFQESCSEIEGSIGNFLWLCKLSASGNKDNLILPLIAINNPLLCLIWEKIAVLLYERSADDRVDAADALISLISDNDRWRRLVMKEEGAEPLLKLLKEGNLKEQKKAAKAIGLLGKDPDSVDQLLAIGLRSVFEKLLKEGPMTVQTEVAWAVSEFAKNQPECQGTFAQCNIMRLLMAHLAFETVHDHSKYAVVMNKATSVRALVNAVANSKEREKERALGLGLDDDQEDQIHTKSWELEDPATKADMKAMAARALGQLAKGNPSICQKISESRALLCFVVLLEKGHHEVRYNSATALMEITAVSENNGELRRSVFKPNSPRCKPVIDQLLRVIETEQDSKLLVPCIKAVGNLAATWTAGTRMSTPLVKFLDKDPEDYQREALLALVKLTSPDNYLHIDHSKAILSAGGAKHLIQIVYFGPHEDQPAALRILCYIACHVPESEQLAEVEVEVVLAWAAKHRFRKEDQTLASLLYEAQSARKPFVGEYRHMLNS